MSRLLVAIPLLVAALALIIWGTLPMWKTTMTIVVLLAAWEWARLAGFSGTASIVYVFFFAILLAAGDTLLAGNLPASSTVFESVCFFWIVGAPLYILLNRRWHPTIFGGLGMVILFATWHAANTLFAQNLYTLLGALAVVWTADTAAYAAGKIAGKTPMAPTVSPGKTWEGFFGGMLAVLLLSYVAHKTFELPSLLLLVSAFALLALSVLGDLFESAAKRHGGVKDSGTLLGGHGGVLDRLDAMLPTLPFAALLSPWLI
ncbi:phosphatidate cytidylyltransferase [Candidatus Persebacteraceae bacterium Df01]|uniref:Phosphatidate cytidylyltransferase n=1 Tax=Candidatus Doriopsillibacter californiensis TaxID=2970740 RepID=A0ABT7QN73_9GAMM|nr:phosphatidate cytidylyltransferase [Candidatus Persebacteraceae bacterium Df01]